MEETTTLEARLGHTFRDRDLLRAALWHPSYRHEHLQEHGKADVPTETMERLAFLGDAVLDLAAAHLEFKPESQPDRGAMTDARKLLVSNSELPKVYRYLGLDELVRPGEGESMNASGREKLEAMVVEALLGAVYRDTDPTHALGVAQRLLVSVFKLPSVPTSPGSSRTPR